MSDVFKTLRAKKVEVKRVGNLYTPIFREVKHSDAIQGLERLKEEIRKLKERIKEHADQEAGDL